ncbi:MAG: prenyltransferase/squalene oxidase repeat-containing protein [Promethearchaeota archaeon]
MINIPFIKYISEENVGTLKYNMGRFSGYHQNPDSRLFIEPDIETNYRAIDSINFSVPGPLLIDPNKYTNSYLAEFAVNYLIEKQNSDGSYSDIGGLGSMFSTFMVVESIDKFDNSIFDSLKNKFRVDRIIDYINNSINDEGWGFKYNNYVNYSDIITTFSAAKLAKRFLAGYLLSNENITKFINSTRSLGGYSLTNITLTPSHESTYYGIRAYLGMNETYTNLDKIAISSYFYATYNFLDGGYRDYDQGFSDVISTYYAISSLYLLGITPINATETVNFILSCLKSDGGFGIRPGNNFTSDFKSGWAAINALSLLEYNVSIPILNDIRVNYHNWLFYHQGSNALFGHSTMESNYFGVLALSSADPQGFIQYININKIIDYTELCFNSANGGYSSQPGLNSSLFATYCAIKLYQFFAPYTNGFAMPNINPTSNYLANLQNADGGFKVGEDVDYVLSLYGGYYGIYSTLINPNVSIIESTYWATTGLRIFDRIDLIDREALNHWLKSCQNADGGFSIFIGFHSDVISTYYGMEIFDEIFTNEPMSKIAAIEFLKNAQASDGSFSLIPALGDYLGLPSFFLVTYLASKALYDYYYQPEDISNALYWFAGCVSSTTGGVGDNPGFGADLRNTPYGIIIIDDLKYDQSFNSKPWNTLLIYILLSESAGITLFIIFKIYQRLSIPQRIKLLLGMGSKLTADYLQQFPAINCENFNVYAGGKLIVDSVSMNVKHGQILGILGESGAGKSTFVKGLLGMRKITGFCQIYGMNTTKRNARRFRPFYGYVPQDLGKIYHNFTTIENLLYFGNQYGLTEKEILSKAKRILRNLEIADKAHELVQNLSGGQKRRVSIAIGLIHSPIFLILDEPTSGLDPIIRENLWLTLTKINEQFKTTLIVITHYPEESRFCNYVAIFGRKRGMIDYGKPKQLLTELPGKGRSIQVIFKEFKTDVINTLESIQGVEKVLEDKAGTDYSIFTNLNINDLFEKIEGEYGIGSIEKLKQTDSRMEQYFRFKAMEVPKVEEL